MLSVQHKIKNIPPEALANNIAHTLGAVQRNFPRAKIFFSPIIPKYDDGSIDVCDKVNKLMASVCQANDYVYVDTRPLFVRQREVKWERLSSRDKLHLNGAGVAAIAKHLKYAVVTTERALLQPLYISQTTSS